MIYENYRRKSSSVKETKILKKSHEMRLINQSCGHEPFSQSFIIVITYLQVIGYE